MVLLRVLGGVCVAGKWREHGHWGWHCDQADRDERGLCLLGFKLAQKLRQGTRREGGGAWGDEENGTKERQGGLKSVGEGERLNEGKFSPIGGLCSFSGTAWLIILSQGIIEWLHFNMKCNWQLGCNCCLCVCFLCKGKVYLSSELSWHQCSWKRACKRLTKCNLAVCCSQTSH